MRKIYGFSPQTRMLYFGAVIVMVSLGLLLITLGLTADTSSYRRSRARSNGFVVCMVGLLAIVGAGAPFQGWRKGSRSRLMITEEALIYEDDGQEKTYLWTDIADVSDMGTYLHLGMKSKGGSVMIPSHFENYPEMVEEIREHARIRPLS